MSQKAITFIVKVKFEGVTKKERPPKTVVHAFDSRGQFLASAPLEEHRARLTLPAEVAGRTVRLLVGPHIEEKEPPTYSAFSRLGAYEKRLRIDLERLSVDLTILDAIWRRWLLCSCVVRGRLVKRLRLPDGTIKELPICHARVTICEVDPVSSIIWRLPDELLYRVRDELLAIIRGPIPFPPPEPMPPGPFPGPLPEPHIRTEEMHFLGEETREAFAAEEQPFESPVTVTDSLTQNRIQALAGIVSAEELRRRLTGLADYIRLYICGWSWLDLFIRYRADCFRTVTVDGDGRFETTIYYPCFGDKPDLYFKAEQLHSTVWETIYAPSVRCNTYWNYECGTEVIINVTDPSAIACVPDDPVEPPEGVATWIMPYAVGGTVIWGTPPGTPTPLPPGPGWVKSDGKTDYHDRISHSDIFDAPFGNESDHRLGFRHGYSNNIPDGIKYYRWSYRKASASDWIHMNEPVFRHYVKQSPGRLPTFPVYKLGPHTVGTESDLFEFKPRTVPSTKADPSDPSGTTMNWPTDDFFADIYSGFLNTALLPPSILDAAGKYQIKLEVFDEHGTLIEPGPETFSFIVPSRKGGSTIQTREAQPMEIDSGGFVFNLHIDNNHSSAFVDAPNIGGTSVADDCGFLRYDLASAAHTTIGFHARHPNNFAMFSFRIFRGATFLAAASAIHHEVAALAAGPYRADGVGNFDNDFARASLLGTCANAAFAERLYVYAKATTGWGHRITAYDASNTRAFALAPEEA